jgi:hypothetical protein
VIALVVVVLFFLHQDFWNWHSALPLLFGFVPIGLAHHALYTLLAAAMMAYMVRRAWPKHLE